MTNKGDYRAALDAHRDRWERMWLEAYEKVSWRPVPAEVRAAAEQRWFPLGSRLLDIGCGTGKTARWLAGEGYRVTAIDFSHTAIEEARRATSPELGMRFAEHDICSGPPPGGPFGALLDWGCLHGVPDVGQEDYVRNLAGVSEEGARLLLFHRAQPGDEGSVIRAVESLLTHEFELVEAEKSMAARVSGWAPGVALWFQRRRS